MNRMKRLDPVNYHAQPRMSQKSTEGRTGEGFARDLFEEQKAHIAAVDKSSSSCRASWSDERQLSRSRGDEY